MSSSTLSAWSLDYASLAPQRGKSVPGVSDPPGAVTTTSVSGSGKGRKSTTSTASHAPSTTADPSALKMRKAWDAAFAPAKSLPMNAFMLYMSGSGVQIFSMMVVGMLITSPFRALFGMGEVFARYESPSHSLLLPKLCYIVCQLACVALGLYKCHSMGLLPTESSDWLAWLQPKVPLEITPWSSR